MHYEICVWSVNINKKLKEDWHGLPELPTGMRKEEKGSLWSLSSA